MNLISKIEHWGDAHHPRWLDVLRIALGIVIFAKGVSLLWIRILYPDLFKKRIFSYLYGLQSTT